MGTTFQSFPSFLFFPIFWCFGVWSTTAPRASEHLIKRDCASQSSLTNGQRGEEKAQKAKGGPTARERLSGLFFFLTRRETTTRVSNKKEKEKTRLRIKRRRALQEKKGAERGGEEIRAEGS